MIRGVPTPLVVLALMALGGCYSANYDVDAEPARVDGDLIDGGLDGGLFHDATVDDGGRFDDVMASLEVHVRDELGEPREDVRTGVNETTIVGAIARFERLPAGVLRPRVQTLDGAACHDAPLTLRPGERRLLTIVCPRALGVARLEVSGKLRTGELDRIDEDGARTPGMEETRFDFLVLAAPPEATERGVHGVQLCTTDGVRGGLVLFASRWRDGRLLPEGAVHVEAILDLHIGETPCEDGRVDQAHGEALITLGSQATLLELSLDHPSGARTSVGYQLQLVVP